MLAFKYRVHDVRLGRFLSVDPLAPKYPANSPYAFSENIVINASELEGLETHYEIHQESHLGDPEYAEANLKIHSSGVLAAGMAVVTVAAVAPQVYIWAQAYPITAGYAFKEGGDFVLGVIAPPGCVDLDPSSFMDNAGNGLKTTLSSVDEVAEDASVLVDDVARGTDDALAKAEDGLKNPAADPLEFKVIQHKSRPGGEYDSHNGFMSAFMNSKFKNYDPDEAIALILRRVNHQKTFGVYNRWRASMKTQIGGVFDWAKVSDEQVLKLTEDMFDAAGVPAVSRAEYYKQFAEFEKTLIPK